MTNTIPNTPDKSIGVYRSENGIQAVTVERIRYAGIHNEGHRFTGVYFGGDKPVLLMTHTTAAQLEDLQKTFAAVEWVETDGDTDLELLKTMIEVINKLMSEIGVTGSVVNLLNNGDPTHVDAVRNIQIADIERGNDAVSYNIKFAGVVDAEPGTYPVIITVPCNLSVDSEPVEMLTDLPAFQEDAQPWVIDVPEKLPLHEYMTNNWYVAVGAIYHGNGRILPDYAIADYGDHYEARVEIKTTDTDESGNEYERVETVLVQIPRDSFVYTDPELSVAEWYSTPEKRRKLAGARQLQTELSDKMKQLAAARVEAFDNLMSALRGALPEMFQEIDALDLAIEATGQGKAVIDKTVEQTEKGIKDAAVYLWERAGRPDNKTSEDGVTQVQVLPNLEINSQVLAFEWASKNEPDMLIKTIDMKKAVKHIRDGGTTPAGCTRTETVSGKIISKPLNDLYLEENES